MQGCVGRGLEGRDERDAAAPEHGGRMLAALVGGLGACAPVAGADGPTVQRLLMPAPAAPERRAPVNLKAGHGQT